MNYPGETLFKVYCVLMTLIYFAVSAAAVAAPFFDIAYERDQIFIFLAMGLVSFPLMLAFGYGAVLPQKSWGYIYGIVAICLGLSSCCLWPICIPLLVMWIKPETKEWFESGDGADGSLR